MTTDAVYIREQSSDDRRIMEAIIRSSYRGVLNREPEKGVREFFSEPYFFDDIEAAFAERIRGFVDSIEFREIMRSRLGETPADYPPNSWALSRSTVLSSMWMLATVGYPGTASLADTNRSRPLSSMLMSGLA